MTSMLHFDGLEAAAGHPEFAMVPLAQPQLIDNLPDVPALPETLLLMQLKLYDFSVDLREISQLVLRDLGATLQILRLASREYGQTEGRPVRIEDCIAGLGLDACLQAAGRRTLLSDSRHRYILEFWAHSRDVAQAARSVAQTSACTIHPDEAGLVGLFHALGSVPKLLSWEQDDPVKLSAARGLRMAERWSLPACVCDYFSELQQPGLPGPWVELMSEAHRKAARSFIECPLYAPSTRLQLVRPT